MAIYLLRNQETYLEDNKICVAQKCKHNLRAGNRLIRPMSRKNEYRDFALEFVTTTQWRPLSGAVAVKGEGEKEGLFCNTHTHAQLQHTRT